MGYECALKIAQQCPQYQVLIASRSNNDNAAVSINQRTGHRNVEYLTLDLSNLVRVRSFAADYAKKGYPQIKALVLNAGLQILDLNYTEDKIESTFAINHVGHALLFYLMSPYLAEDARILITSSGTHDPAQKSGLPDAVYNSAEELAQPTKETGKYSGRQRYATSKLCNIMWMYALHRRLERTSCKKWIRPWFDARDRLDERSSSNSAIHLAPNHAPDHLAAATTRLSEHPFASGFWGLACTVGCRR